MIIHLGVQDRRPSGESPVALYHCEQPAAGTTLISPVENSDALGSWEWFPKDSTPVLCFQDGPENSSFRASLEHWKQGDLDKNIQSIDHNELLFCLITNEVEQTMMARPRVWTAIRYG